jgi:Leucine-rich repeat (LRR) protein
MKRVISIFVVIAIIVSLKPIAEVTAANTTYHLSGQTITDKKLAEMIADGTISRDVTQLTLANTLVIDLSVLSELTNLRNLLIMNSPIINFSPLFDLPNLTYLHLNHNQISDLTPLAGLTNLTALNLGNNQISDLTPLSGLTNLTYLNLGNNQINDITPLAGLSVLNSLGLSNNQISDLIPLAGLTDLGSLYLDNNQISDLTPLTGLENLTMLHLRNNQISDITPLSEMTTPWYRIILSNNQVSDITPLYGLTALFRGYGAGISLENNPVTLEQINVVKEVISWFYGVTHSSCERCKVFLPFDGYCSDYCAAPETIPPIEPFDYTFTINSALSILKHLAKLEPLSAAMIERYDFFGDGQIGINNALEILKYLAKLDNVIG